MTTCGTDMKLLVAIALAEHCIIVKPAAQVRGRQRMQISTKARPASNCCANARIPCGFERIERHGGLEGCGKGQCRGKDKTNSVAAIGKPAARGGRAARQVENAARSVRGSGICRG